MSLPPLPPHVQARVDELLACAPPLTESQKRVIRALGRRPQPAAATQQAA